MATAILLLLLASCDGRSGYYDGVRKEVIAKLTSQGWRMTYEHTPAFAPVESDGESWIYIFNSNGTGSYRWAKWDGGSEEPIYFHWTFTSDNFAVIYIDRTGRFWLIDRLTATELWVYNSVQNPVIYPNSDKTFYKFAAVRQ